MIPYPGYVFCRVELVREVGEHNGIEGGTLLVLNMCFRDTALTLVWSVSANSLLVALAIALSS